MKPDGVYKPVTTKEQFEELLTSLHNSKDISVDVETSGLDYLHCELYGIAISPEPRKGYYIPIRREPKPLEQLSLFVNESEYLELDYLKEGLNPILSNGANKYLHNAKFDLHILQRYGFRLENHIFDTILGAWILGNTRRARYGLKTLVEKKLGYKMTQFGEVSKGQQFNKVPIREAADYAAADTDMTLRLAKLEKEIFENYPELEKVFHLELEFLPVLLKMEQNGVLIDKPHLRKLGREYSKQIKTLTQEVYKQAGEVFVIGSVTKNGDLPRIIKKLTNRELGNYDEVALQDISTLHPIINKILEWRKATKIKSVYIDGILSKVGEDGRLHTEYRQSGINTGRVSSNAPNLQNIPVKHSIRSAFIVPNGHKFVSVDYSQLELRIISHIAEEGVWIEAFHREDDIHSATAATVLDKPIEEVTKEERRSAKTINFGLLYGMTAFGLSKRLGITKYEAEQFISKYFSRLPKIRDYIDLHKQLVDKRGWVSTPFGRRLYFQIDRTNPKALFAAQREGINMPIQGFAADIVKMAMIGCHKLIKDYETLMLMQVHDEIDFEMPTNEMDILIPQIIDIMSNVVELRVPLVVDVEYGDNWEELEDYRLNK